MKQTLLSTALMLACALGTFAQWSDNPATNNRVTPSNVAFYDPQMLTNADGVTYFFFIVPSRLADGTDAFQYRMQILDADGKRVYGAAGKVLSHERNITWTKFNDYILIDNDGNCIVSCFDLRDSSPTAYDFNYYIYKIAPTGEILWGPVTLNSGRGCVDMTGLSMCATDDGGSAYAYSLTNEAGTQRITHLERMDRDGNLLWAEPVVVEPDNETSRPLLVNNGDNEVMLLYQDAVGQYVARVYDAEGKDVWGESVAFYSGGFSSDKVYPSLNVQRGPDGGAVMCLMDGGWDGRIIYLTRDGAYGFPTANFGTRVAGPDYQTAVPSAYYDQEDEAFYVAYSNMADYGQGGHGVNIQKFSRDGLRQWGDDGISIIATTPGQQVGTIHVREAGEGQVAVFSHYMGSTAFNDPVSTYITLIDKDGKIVNGPIDFTTSSYTKNNLLVSGCINDDHYIVGWTEKRSTSNTECIYAQYVKKDGSTSGIEQLEAATTQEVRYYDLEGRRVNPDHVEPMTLLIQKDGTSNKLIVK